MNPVKRRARLYIFLVIVFSFLLGLPYHTLDFEVVSINNLLNGLGSAIGAVKILLLVIAHLLLMSLLFIKESGRYKMYLILFPFIFAAVYLTNTISIYTLEPRLASWFLPYFVGYGLAVYTYSQYEASKR